MAKPQLAAEYYTTDEMVWNKAATAERPCLNIRHIHLLVLSFWKFLRCSVLASLEISDLLLK